MASIIHFDQFLLIDKLKAAGISAEQSEAIVRSIATAQDGLVTKEYLDKSLSVMEQKLESKISLLEQKFEGKFNLMYWMISANTAMLMLLIGKVFFQH